MRNGSGNAYMHRMGERRRKGSCKKRGSSRSTKGALLVWQVRPRCHDERPAESTIATLCAELVSASDGRAVHSGPPSFGHWDGHFHKRPRTGAALSDPSVGPG